MSESAAAARPPASTRTSPSPTPRELLDGPLGVLVGLLAEVAEPHAPVASYEEESRPVAVPERLPDGEVVVDDDGIADPQVARGAADVVEVVLEPELGRV